MHLFPNPAFIDTFIKWEKRHKVFPNPALRFGTKRVQATRDVTARKIPLPEWLWTGTGLAAVKRWQMKSEITAAV